MGLPGSPATAEARFPIGGPTNRKRSEASASAALAFCAACPARPVPSVRQMPATPASAHAGFPINLVIGVSRFYRTVKFSGSIGVRVKQSQAINWRGVENDVREFLLPGLLDPGC